MALEHRKLALVIMSLLLGAFAMRAESAPSSSPPDVFVNNRRFAGVVLRSGAEVMVGLDAMAAALKVTVTRDPATGRALVGGRVLTSQQTLKGPRGGLVVVSLKELVASAGGRVMEHPAMGMVDVITFDPAARAKVVTARKDGPPVGTRGAARRAAVDRNRVADAACLGEIFDTCIAHLRVHMGMEVKSPIIRCFVPLETIQKKIGNCNVQGFTQFRYNPDRGCDEVLLYIPTGQDYDHAVHVMAHELGHAWQFDAHVRFGTASLSEGFCEWVASDVLESMGLSEELALIEDNYFWEYSDGYLYVKRMVAKIGPRAMIERFRDSSRKD